MVPRSLAVAVAIGAASGAAAALVLSEARAGDPGGPFELEAALYRHDPGRPVELLLTNASDAPLPLGRLEVSGLAGMHVYGRDLGGSLEPGESAFLEWDQTGPGGAPAFAGIYRIQAGDPPASAVVEVAGAGLSGD